MTRPRRPIRPTRRWIPGGAVSWALAALLAGAPAGAASAESIVTAVIGSATADGVALERQAKLADGDPLQTGADGACSILVDDETILEVCQGTSLRLGHRDGRPDGPRVLELRTGEIRVLAAPRPPGRRIEVHTPAAIATILGSALYVSVDARGVTTIASAESRARVESARRLGRAITLTEGQQVTVRPGAPLPRFAETWDPKTSPADGCLIDFGAIAFEGARAAGDDRALAEITTRDVVDTLPQVGARRESIWESPLVDAWIDPKLHPIYDPIDTGAAGPPPR